MQLLRFLSIGEIMIELSDAGNGLMRKGFAGDTFNTAYYARACLPEAWQVDYLTALGDDPASADVLDFIGQCGIGTQSIRILKGRAPGLYMIHLNNGERSFSYWRGQSAARKLADDPDWLAARLNEAGLCYLSGITLAILPQEGRHTLLAALKTARARGKIIAFDPNLRPRLWSSQDEMADWIMRIAAVSDIVLPGLDDEMAYFGDRDCDDTITRYRKARADHIVVKDGAKGATIDIAGQRLSVAASPVETIVDTTAAGDSFNGAYLAGFLTGQSPQQAARHAAQIAARVISHRGAIVALEHVL